MEDRTCGITSGKPPPKSLGPEVIEHKKKIKKTKSGRQNIREIRSHS